MIAYDALLLLVHEGAQESGRSIGAPLLMVGLLIGAVTIGAIAVWIIRTRLLSDRSASDRGLFDELRRMRDEGQLSEDEYQAVKGSAVKRERERMARDEQRSESKDESTR